MSWTSPARRFWTRPLTRRPAPRPAGAVGQPLELLEDRTTPSITLSFLAGVATFTSNSAGDTLQVQATATPADILYNSGGIGLASLTGVTQLIFNGNGGTDLLILQSPAGTHFAPTSGIVYNAGGDAGDRLEMIGGAATWTGTYAPTGTQAGSLSFTNNPGALTQNITFTGVPTIRNSMSGAAMAITTPGTNDTINVETGPNLANVGAVQQGPVLIDGGDRDDHGSFGSGGTVQGFYNATTLTDFSQNLDAAGVRWSLNANANIPTATTVPHASVNSTAGTNTLANVDYYRVATTTDNATITVAVTGASGFTPRVTLYDDQGNVIATGAPSLSATVGHADPYYIGVSRSADTPITGGFATTAQVTPGSAYTLNVSVDTHALTAGSDPVAEAEANQSTFVLPAANLLGWQFIQQGVDFVHDNAFNAVPLGNEDAVLAVGLTGYSATGTQAGKALWNVAQVLGLNVTTVTGAAIGTVNLNNYRMIYVPTGLNQTVGGISQADKDAFALRTTDIRDYINSGGGMFALTEDSLSTPFNWLQIPDPFTISTGPLPNGPNGAGTDALRKTAAAISAGLTISDTDLTLGTPYHNVFTGPVGFNNLLPFVLNSVNAVVALGLGAIMNPGLGGAGPSTAITFGINPLVSPTFPTMYVTATPGLSLNGALGADTYNIQLGTPVINVIAVADSGGTPDVANLFGTTAIESFNVNVAAANTVFYVGPTSETVTFAGLETLTLDGKNEPNTPSPVTGDTFTVRPHPTTAITVTAGDPTIYPGDTLTVDLIGLVGLNPTLSDPALPSGNLTLTGYGTLTWTGIENFPVPRGLGGSFDFGPTGSPVQFGFTGVLPSQSYPAAAAEGTGWHGWATTPQYGNVAYNETNLPAAVAASPFAALLRDYAYGWNSAADIGVFRVDVAPNKPLQLTAILGTPLAPRDGQVVEWGVANTPTGLPTTWTAITPTNGTFTVAGEMTGVSAMLTAAQVGNNLSLFVRFRDIGGGEPYWSVSALDVRPTNPGAPTLLPAGLVAPLPIRREFSTDGSQPTPGSYANLQAFAALASDGATIDYYRGKDAIPNSMITVTTTNGTPVDAAYTAADMALGTRVLNGDGAGYYRSFQVQADAVGEFTFGVRRPTGNAPATVTVADTTGFRAGVFTQDFTLPTARRLDFGPLPGATTSDYGNGGTVGVGYIPFATATYTSAAVNALGWSSAAPLPIPFTPGGSGVNVVQQDGVFGGYAPSEFVLDMPTGGYVLTATLADNSDRRDDIFVEVFNGTTWVPAQAFNPMTGAYDTALTGLTSPPGTSPNLGQSLARTFLLSTSNNVGGIGQLRVRIGNVTSDPYWSLSALDVRPTQAGLAVTVPGGTLPANGITASNFTVNTAGVPNGTLLTVRVGAGRVVGTDQNNTYDGFQILSTGATTTISVVAPDSSAAVTSFLEVETLAGEARGAASQAYSGVAPAPAGIQRFDFNGPTNTTAAGVTAVRGNLLQSTTGPVAAYPANPVNPDYGWTFPVGEFDRAPSSLPASMTADQKALFQDGVSLNATRATFRVKVGAGQYGVRYYIGDSSKKWPWIQIQVEGQNSTPVASTGQLKTNLNQYWSYVLQGSDVAGPGGVGGPDGYLDISIFGANVWVLNGLDVAAGGIGSLPPSLFAPSPQRAAFQVTSGTAAKLTRAELAPVVAEAVRRWAAAGADPARLMGVTVSITDLNDAGRLGEHVPGSVHIDDDAGGRGWFVDATPADDAEFGASVSVGLGATDGAAARGVDLLTVVMHELGHELGLDDVDPAAAPADLMAETLDVGVRRLPAGLEAEQPAAVRPPARPTAPAKPSAATETRPALWLDEAKPLYTSGAPVVATDDRLQLPAAPVEPVRVDPAPAKAVAPALAATPAWPDADNFFDFDGVYVG